LTTVQTWVVLTSVGECLTVGSRVARWAEANIAVGRGLASGSVEAWIIGAGVDVGLTEGAGVASRAGAGVGGADDEAGAAVQARVVQAWIVLTGVGECLTVGT